MLGEDLSKHRFNVDQIENSSQKINEFIWERPSIRIPKDATLAQLKEIYNDIRSKRSQLQRDPLGGILLTQPKTAKSVRKVQMGKETLGALMLHFQLQCQALEIEPAHDDLLFISLKGKALRSSGVQKSFKRLLALAGVPNIRFHDLRHTAASLLLATGMPLLEVSRQLGHSRASTTLDVYGHLVPGKRSNAVEKIDQLLSETTAELPQSLENNATNALQLMNNTNNKSVSPSKIV